MNSVDPTAPLQTLVFLDPSSPQGESALAELGDDDRQVTLIVRTLGPQARSLRNFAASEKIDVGAAADRYLRQVANRLKKAGHQVQVIRIDGVDDDAMVAELGASDQVRRVLRPEPPGLATRLAASASDNLRHLREGLGSFIWDDRRR